MKDYDDISELITDISENIISVSYGKLKDEVEELYGEEAEYIYSEYNPQHDTGSRYRRGLDGSFADKINFKTEIDISKSGLDMELSNQRISDCTCSYCSSKTIYLDMLIEEGIYGKSRLMKRPVYQRSQDRIEEEELTENILASELKKRGFEIE